MRTSDVRPSGITILVILELIISVILLIGGMALAALSGDIEGYLPSIPSLPGLFAREFLVVIGVVLIIISLLGFLVSWGLWTGKGWAWTLALILAILGVIEGLISLPGGIISVIIDGFIVWYLWQPHVKAFYRMGPLPYTPAQPSPTPQPVKPSQPNNIVYCSKCGTANDVTNRFCRNCGAEIKT